MEGDFLRILRERTVLIQTLQIAAIALIAGFIMYYAVSQILLLELENSLLRFAQQGATTIDTFLSGRISEIRSLATNSIINDTNLPFEQRLEELQKQLKLGNYKRLSLADLDGNSETTDGIKLQIGDREYYKKALQGITNVSDPVSSRADGTLVIAFATPLLENGKITGVLYATFDATVLSHMTDKIKLSDNGNTFILNSKGNTIAHDDRNLVYKSDNSFDNIKNNPELEKLVQLKKKMVAGERGSGDYYYNGEVKYMGFCPIENTGWSIAVAAPKREIFSKLNIVFGILIILVLTASLTIAIIISRSRLIKNNLHRQLINTSRIADFTNLIALSVNCDGVILTSNRHAENMLGYFGEYGKNKIQNLFELLSSEESEKLKNIIISSHLQNSSASFELALKRGDSDTAYIYCSTMGDKENYDVLEISGIDITERVEQQNKLQDSFEELTLVYDELAATEEKIRQLAYTDSLTGLPNRVALYNEIEQIIAMADEASQFALLYMDLDNFKFINDSFSHSVGDLLLVEIGKRLKTVHTENEIIARFEGDEFVVLIKQFQTREELNIKIQSAMGIFDENFSIMGNNFHLSASCGISIYSEHADSTEEMLKCSDVAMYYAKKDGKRKYIVYERSMNDEFIKRINMENGLRQAIKNNEFVLHYQPQIDLLTGKTSGFEALIRWLSPQRGMIAPLEFIHVAEETGLIVQIGRWVLHTACDFIKKLNDSTQSSYGIAVNISVLQLMQANFVGMVIEVLNETALDPALLELELTESKLIEAMDLNLQKLTELRNMGVKLSVDDFGKGFSSLSYLKLLPIHSLKIDKSFVDDIPEDDNCMIESIIHIGHQCGLVVIAEGVEKQEQLEYLDRYSCDKVQGFYYSRPVPEKEIYKMLMKNGDGS